MLNTLLNKDYVRSWLSKIQRAKKSNITMVKRKAKHPPKPYLGVVLILLKIVYYALDKLDELPPPWDVLAHAVIERKTMIPLERVEAQEQAKKR